MNRLLTAAVIAAVTTAATWAVRRVLEPGTASVRPRRQPLETWENEGGALAPTHVMVETSQVPR